MYDVSDEWGQNRKSLIRFRGGGCRPSPQDFDFFRFIVISKKTKTKTEDNNYLHMVQWNRIQLIN